MSKCSGCFPIYQANQLAHMDPGGCLYCEDNDSKISDSSSLHNISEDGEGDETVSWATRVLKTIEESKTSTLAPSSENGDEQECCICFETIGAKNNCVTECGHKFCFKCLATAMTRNNACPCCRMPLIDVQEEDDESEYEESYDEGEDSDDEEGNEDDESEAPVEVIVERLKKNGFKMIDVVSLYLGRFSKTDSKYTDEHIFEISKKFDEIQVNADAETMEQRMFAEEDTRAVA